MSAYVLLSSVPVRNPESRVSLSYIADHIGGSRSESSPHTRSVNALAQVALARRFNIRVMLRIEKTEALTKTMLLLMFGWKPRIGTLILPHCKVVRELIAKLNCGNIPVK